MVIRTLLNPEDEIKLAKTELYRLSMDSVERERYNMREKAIYDKISSLENAEEKCIKKGIKEGEKKKSIEIAKNLLLVGVDLDVIIKSTGLSKDEIELLKK